MASATLLSRFAFGVSGALTIVGIALAQPAPPPAPAPASPYPPTATITTPGYPAQSPADPKLQSVGLPNGKKIHLLPATLETTQWGWFDNAQAPVLRVNSGDTIALETMMHSHNQVVPGATIEQIKKLRTDFPGRGPHTLTGPIYIEGAQPGDVLKVTLNKIVPRAYATNFNVPGMFGQFPNVYSGRAGQISLSRPRQDADRVPARHRAAAAPVPRHARRRAQGARPLLERAAGRVRRQHGHPRLRRRHLALRAGARAGRAAVDRRLAMPARATARSTSPRSRPPTASSTSPWR